MRVYGLCHIHSLSPPDGFHTWAELFFAINLGLGAVVGLAADADSGLAAMG